MPFDDDAALPSFIAIVPVRMLPRKPREVFRNRAPAALHCARHANAAGT